MEQPSFSTAFTRLEGRINWERRDRSSGWRVALDPIHALLAALGHPESEQRIVHVAGSKGKGSVSSLVTQALILAGHTVGTYGSPHVDSITERVRLNGRNAAEAQLATALEEVLDAVEAGEAQGDASGDASWFDIMTAAALVAFRTAKVDFIVLEVGLGGRLDSTNAIPAPEVAVVTTIALEHTEVLGTTHAAIAAEKGGIVKAGSHFVSGCDAASEAGAVLAAIARERGVAEFRVAFDEGDGTFDEANQRVAAAALDCLRERGLTAATLSGAAIEAARLPGRMEQASFEGTPVLLDGAHVPESMAMAVRQARLTRPGPMRVVLAVHKEKKVEELVAPLVESGAVELVCCSIPTSGVHLSAEGLAESLSALFPRVAVRAAPSAAEALRTACSQALTDDGGWVFVTGSLYVIGAVRSLLGEPS